MAVFDLSTKPSVAAAVEAHLPVSSRLEATMAQAGYVIGSGGIQVYPDGSVTIDADRDPTAAWTSFDPTIPTARETGEATMRQQVRSALTDLATIQAQAPTATTAQMQSAIGKMAGIQAAAIKVLIQCGVLGEEGNP